MPATMNPEQVLTCRTLSMYPPVMARTRRQIGNSFAADISTLCQSSASPTVRARIRRPAASLVTAVTPAATKRARRWTYFAMGYRSMGPLGGRRVEANFHRSRGGAEGATNRGSAAIQPLVRARDRRRVRLGAEEP